MISDYHSSHLLIKKTQFPWQQTVEPSFPLCHFNLTQWMGGVTGDPQCAVPRGSHGIQNTWGLACHSEVRGQVGLEVKG